MPAPIQPFEPDEAELIISIGKRVSLPEAYRGEWHVFTDGTDEWFDLADEAGAKALFDEWAAEEDANVRMYLEIYDRATDEHVDETCWHAFGEWPY